MLSLGLAFQAQAQESSIDWYENLFHLKKKGNFINNQIAADKELLNDADQLTKVKALIELGVFYQTYGVVDYGKALDILNRSVEIEDSLNMNSEKIFSFLAIAQVYENVGILDKSIDNLQRAQPFSEHYGSDTTQLLISSRRGRVYAAQHKDSAAFDNYENALEKARDLKLLNWQAEVYIHLGKLYSAKKEKEKSLENFKNALEIYRDINDKPNEAVALNEVGEMYQVIKNYDRALANHKAAIEIREKLKDDNGLAQSYNNVGILYFNDKNYKRAIANLLLALQAGNTAHNQNELLTTSDYLSQCYREEKDFKEALKYREQYVRYEDFINKEKDELQLIEKENQKIVDEKESKISELNSDIAENEKELKKQKRDEFYLILFALFVAIVAGVIGYLLYVNKKKERKLQETNDTKDKLFSIIGHDLKGPLNSLTSFSSLLLNHIDMISKEEIKMLSVDIDKSLKNLFTLLENLLEWSRSQTGNIDFKPEDFDLADVLKENETLLKIQAQNKNITIVNENKNPLPVSLHKNSINTVVRNLLSNAIKFTPENGTITLRADERGKDYLISVTDTGVGMSPAAIQKLFKIGTKHSTLGTAKEKGTGLGLILCKDFVEKNGGSIGVESKEGVGSKFYFFVPKK